MMDHYDIYYLFDHPWLNRRKDRWMGLISKFYFEMKQIKLKEN
jgi:hypothetical protein